VNVSAWVAVGCALVAIGCAVLTRRWARQAEQAVRAVRAMQMPEGLIESTRELTDDEWQQFRKNWEADHGRFAGRVGSQFQLIDVTGLGKLPNAVAGRPVVIFNASYDLTLLDRECRRHQVTPLADILGEDMPLFVVDPLVIDREWIPRRTGKGVRRLTYLCQHVYGVPLSDSDAHGSTADALAAARVAWVQARRFPALGAMPLPLLQKRQAMWHRRWADEFGAWLASQGKPDDVERDWPMRQGGPA
jgi:hypothetical protein